MNASSQQSIVQPGEGRLIAGLGAHAKVPAGAFDGRLFIFEGTFEPGMFIPPHTHTHEDEVTFVLSGSLTVDVGGQVSTAAAGAFVIKPRGVHHSMWNHTDQPARVLELHTPGLMEPYYDALGRLFTTIDLEDVERQAAITELHLKYGIVYHLDLVSEVVTADGQRPRIGIPARS
jgi:mannose-6-phosphate isomerase-like protein (cupin superfamily)